MMKIRRLTAVMAALVLGLYVATAAAAVAVTKSPNDPRGYAYLELNNGLKVLLVSDPKATKAAAAMDVHVGSFADPGNHLGLAHFLEHMLFLGSKKYPEAGAYDDFITSHGGGNNAFTTDEHTRFYFDIQPEYLAPALDRFAQFFIAPAFTPKYVDKERHAVDSEYHVHIKQDGWRVQEVEKALAAPDHPFSRFSIGSLDTLSNKPDDHLRADLIKFYDDHYSADRMTLVVLGHESLPALRKLVTDEFSAVPKRATKTLPGQGKVYTSKQEGQDIRIQSVGDYRLLSLRFPIPSQQDYYASKPADYLANLLGDQSPGGLYSTLKARDWINDISAGNERLSPSQDEFHITFTLTPAGLKHVDAITGLTLNYLDQLRAKGVKKWRFEEYKRIRDLDFRFQDKEDPADYVTDLAGNLQDYPPTEVLTADALVTHYDPARIKAVLAAMKSTDMRRLVIANDIKGDKVEPYFGAHYAEQTISQKEIKDWLAVADEKIALPPPNPFLPDDVKTVAVHGDAQYPVRLALTDTNGIWYLHDPEFVQPKTDFSFFVSSPLTEDTARDDALSDLYASLLADSLSEVTYAAQAAGLSYSISSQPRGISIGVGGFTAKQDKLLDLIVTHMADLKIDPVRFAAVKDQFRRQLANFTLAPPVRQAMTEMQALMEQPSWTPAQELVALEDISAADVSDYAKRFLATARLEFMVDGNMPQELAVKRATAIVKHFDLPSPKGDDSSIRVMRLAAGSKQEWLIHPRATDAAVVAYAQAGDDDAVTQAQALLLGDILSTPFYTELRTNQQLGYIVYAGGMPLLHKPGLIFAVQSANTDPAGILKSMDDFQKAFRAKLKAMPEKELALFKKSLIQKLLQRPNNLQEKTARFMREIDEGTYAFDLRARLAKQAEKVDLGGLLKAYDQLLLDAKSQRVLIVRTPGKVEQSVTAGAITDVSAFKAKADYFPAATH